MLLLSKKIKKYKITGPLACGKSMTLFKISKSYPNIIYINLKKVKSRNDNIAFLEMFFSECSKITLDKIKQEKFKQIIKFIDISQNRLNILLSILEIILDLKNENILLILDQYKKKNI